MQNTHYLYSLSQYLTIVKHFNDTMYREDMGTSLHTSTLKTMAPGGYLTTFEHQGVFQARNLHFRDLVYGGLVGNGENQYRVTVKADGVRKFLLFYQREVWLVHPAGEANRVIVNLPDDTLHGFIFEGELIPIEKRNFPLGTDPNNRKKKLDGTIADHDIPTNPYWFLIFDTIAKPILPSSRAQTLISGHSNQHGGAHGKIEAGDISVQLLPHFATQNDVAINKDKHISSRMRYAEWLVTNLTLHPYFKSTESPLYINTKQFHLFRTPRHFFDTMASLEMDRQSGVNPYFDDGYIFMPTRMPYTQWYKYRNRREFPLHRRWLGEYPDICKWKPVQQMTIDFVVNFDLNPVYNLEDPLAGVKIEYRASLQTGGGVFTGTDRYPYSDQVDVASIERLNPERVSGLVTELRWDTATGKFMAERIREDKLRPNSKDVADDNWNWIFDPIPVESLTGYDTKLMRKYHNRIKRRIHARPPPKFIVHETSISGAGSKGKGRGVSGKKGGRGLARKPGYNLLGLGVGGGGDVFSWQKSGYERIVAVEPNSTNIRELYHRATSLWNLNSIQIVTRYDTAAVVEAKIGLALSRDDPLVIIQTLAQDYDLISTVVSLYLQQPVSVCSLMLSMSFLWESEDDVKATLQTIVRNLSANGEIRFFTIDGDLVEQTFSPAFSGPTINNPLTLGPVTLEYYPQGKTGFNEPPSLDISIPDSILEGTQHEWLVRLDDFTRVLALYGMHLDNHLVADSEGFLPEHSRVLSSMYSYGWYVPNQPDPSLSLVTLDQRAQQIRSGNPDLLNLPPLTVASPLLKHLESSEKSAELLAAPTKESIATKVDKGTVGEEMREQSTTIPSIPTIPTIPWIPPTPLEETEVYRSVVESNYIPLVNPFQTPSLQPPSLQPPSLQPPSLQPPSLQPQVFPIEKMPAYPEDNIFFRFQERLTMERPGLPILLVGPTGVGDDAVSPVLANWYTRDPVYRVACIGDSSCFFHSVLKVADPSYFTSNSGQRRQIVAQRRAYLANKLAQPDPNALQSDVPGSKPLIYWETASRGSYPQHMSEYEAHGIQPGEGILDFSLAGLQRLLNSNEYIGSELYQYVSEDIQANIHVLFGSGAPYGLMPFESTGFDFPINLFLIAVGGTLGNRHYELLAVNRNSDGRILTTVPDQEKSPIYQTHFNNVDPFVFAFRCLEVYRKIFSSLKSIYEKYRLVLQKGIQDEAMYYELDQTVAEGKKLYESVYPYMILVSGGDMSVDYVRYFDQILKSMEILQDRAVKVTTPYLS
jgi:hypothetical protein